jgi:competence ComEA-like helix-hairpin-helix protein
MKQIFFLLVFATFFSFVSATCNSGQIDINTASLSDLDKITGVGPATAQKIVDGRTYNSLENLIDVKGIGPLTLEKIKTQNLACVENENSANEEKETSEEETKLEIEKNSNPPSQYFSEEISPETINPIQSESIINLNQDIELQQNKQTVYESKTEKIRKYSIYGFALFLIFLIIVLLVKN